MSFRHEKATSGSHRGHAATVRWFLTLAAIHFCTGVNFAQIAIDANAITPRGDTAFFWLQVPANYSPSNPPAILVWWHELPADEHQMVGNPFSTVANERGWIIASHAGPADSIYAPHRHWNTAWAQLHCRVMLDWIAASYPFHRDSIYMIGASMGGAGGQIWHNNNCGSEDYLIAATAGASQILDCQLRQDQYLAQNDTNRSMRNAFGGLPCERDSVAFEYQRASAIHVRDSCDGDPTDMDTSQSMHYNSLHLPVWITWGADNSERERYRGIAQSWDSLRRALGADTTWMAEASISGHGAAIMGADSICAWLSGFSANRYPDDLSISADENGDYYWTQVTLVHNDTVFGRYGAHKNFASRQLDLTLIHNISSLRVNFTFPWPEWDSLSGRWLNFDRDGTTATIELARVPPVLGVYRGSTLVPFTYADSTLTVTHEFNDRYTVYFEPYNAVEPMDYLMPVTTRLVAAYPNPLNAQFILEIEAGRGIRSALDFYDETGRLAKTMAVGLTAGTQRLSISAHEFPSGVYFMQLRESRSAPLKIVVVR